MDVNEIDLSSFEIASNPYPIWDKLLAKTPVFWYDRFQCWVVLDYENVKNGLKDGVNFSNDRTDVFIKPIIEKYHSQEAGIRAYAEILKRMFMHTDGDYHMNIRRHWLKTVTPERIVVVTAYMNSLADKLLDNISQNEDIDLIEHYVTPLIARAVATFIGIPEEKFAQFLSWYDSYHPMFGAGDLTFEEYLKAQGKVKELETITPENKNITPLLDMEKGIEILCKNEKQHTQNDVIGNFVESQKSDPLLTDKDVFAQAMLTLATHFSVKDTLSLAILSFINDSNVRQQFLQDPNETAMNELMRYFPSENYLHRIAINDVKIENFEIKKGQFVLFGIAASNRDPKVFQDPSKIDFTRTNNNHLTFGHGPHSCPGHYLGKSLIKNALQKLFKKFPNIQLDPNRELVRNFNQFLFNSVNKLPVKIL